MFTKINDVEQYTFELGQRVPSLAQEVIIRRPGLSAVQVTRLDPLWLPPIYKQCIQNLDLHNRTIGYFSLSPEQTFGMDLIETLLSANASTQIGMREVRDEQLVFVAEQEANLICVGSAVSNYPDVVFALDIMRSSGVVKERVARSFEVFLILAANLHRLSREDSIVMDDAKNQMRKCCAYLDCNAEETGYWATALGAVM
jgi:hypothetical protein